MPRHVKNKPALLVSYVYLPQFKRERHRYRIRNWSMDSGAYSAHNSGKTIELEKYTAVCSELLAKDKGLVEVFALDVIGDFEASARNSEWMVSQGVPAIPTFHFGEPEDMLFHYAEKYPKIALGGCVGVPQRTKREWHEQCFARVWPKLIHGLAVGNQSGVLNLPWDSVDASSWERGPTAYGRWRTYGQLSVYGGEQNLAPEVEDILQLEKLSRFKHGATLRAADKNAVFDYRLAYGGPPEALVTALA